MLKIITSLFALCLLFFPLISIAQIDHNTSQKSYEACQGSVEDNILAEGSKSASGSAARDENAESRDQSSQLVSVKTSKTWTLYIVRESLEPGFKFPVFSKGSFL